MSKADRFRRMAEERLPDASTTNKSVIIDKIVGADPTTHNGNTETDNENVTELLNSETEQENNSLLRNTFSEQSSVTVNMHTEQEELNVTNRPRTPKLATVPKAIEEFEKRLRRPTIEETHTRQTWLINNELLRRLNKLARNQGKGFKTHLINYALERVLDELEGK